MFGLSGVSSSQKKKKRTNISLLDKLIHRISVTGMDNYCININNSYHKIVHCDTNFNVPLGHTISRISLQNSSIPRKMENELSKPRTTRQFYMGPALSGAPFHYHGPAINTLM